MNGTFLLFISCLIFSTWFRLTYSWLSFFIPFILIRLPDERDDSLPSAQCSRVVVPRNLDDSRITAKKKTLNQLCFKENTLSQGFLHSGVVVFIKRTILLFKIPSAIIKLEWNSSLQSKAFFILISSAFFIRSINQIIHVDLRRREDQNRRPTRIEAQLHNKSRLRRTKKKWF